MYVSRGGGEIGDIQFCLMSGMHERTIRVLDADWIGRDAFVDYARIDGAEVVCTSGVGNGSACGI
jgi:hypothetical protein